MKAAAAADPASDEDEPEEQTIDPESLDPLDPRRVSLDIFELYCYEAIMTNEVGRRVFLIKKLRYMIHRLIGRQYAYGRLYNYTNIANMVSRICGRYAYNMPENEVETTPQLQNRLIDFEPEMWGKVLAQFSNIRGFLVRKDAAFTVLPVEIEEIDGADEEDLDVLPKEDDSVNLKIENLDEFSVTYCQMNNLIKFHACLSHIQPYFEDAIEGGTGLIPSDNIVAFHRAISDLFGDEEENEYAEILRSLFSKNKPTRTNRSGVLSLKSFKDLKKIHLDNSREFDLVRFQKRFIRLIRQWTELVLPVPNLAKFGYGSTITTVGELAEPKAAPAAAEEEEAAEQNDVEEDSSNESQIKLQPKRKRQKPKSRGRNEEQNFFSAQSNEESESEVDDPEGNEAVANLQRKRKSTEQKLKDPLPEAVARAASLPARAVESHRAARLSAGGTEHTKGTLYQKKKSAQQMTFDDSNEDESDDGMKMSALPNRPKKPEGSRPTPQIDIQQLAGQRSGPKKRKRFTAEEDQAIMEGVQRFGAGKWSEIKSTYSMELRDRDTIQIKDRYRNMTKSAA